MKATEPVPKVANMNALLPTLSPDLRDRQSDKDCGVPARGSTASHSANSASGLAAPRNITSVCARSTDSQAETEAQRTRMKIRKTTLHTFNQQPLLKHQHVSVLRHVQEMAKLNTDQPLSWQNSNLTSLKVTVVGTGIKQNYSLGWQRFL